MAIRTSTLDDPALIQDWARTLNMFSLVFGIPLSFAAGSATGIALGIGTRWGVFRYPWVVTKLLLVVTVMLVGGFVLGPASNQMLDGRGDATDRLIARAAYDVVALTVATAAGVFKPGRPFRCRVEPSRCDDKRSRWPPSTRPTPLDDLAFSAAVDRRRSHQAS